MPSRICRIPRLTMAWKPACQLPSPRWIAKGSILVVPVSTAMVPTWTGSTPPAAQSFCTETRALCLTT